MKAETGLVSDCRSLSFKFVDFLVDLGEVAELSSSNCSASLLEKTDELRVLKGESDVCNSDWSHSLFRIKHAWLG